jgi:uncharacterized metal-binding protein
MPDLPQKKVGIIACSGEELPSGTATREAALLVLERLRPQQTVTLCLPLFLAGEERERAFARFFPTIAVDGCDKRCAARATEKYSARPAASIVVDELRAQMGLEAPQRVRGAEEARRTLVVATADAIAWEVDRLLGQDAAAEQTPQGSETASEGAAVCSCTSDIPVERIEVDGKTVELVALPAVFELVLRLGHRPDGAATSDAILELVRVYNAVAPEDEEPLRTALAKAYEEYCSRGAGK